MSELTSCNHCNLRRIKDDAKKQRERVTVIADAHWGMGGVNVYVHPKDVNVRSMKGGEEGARKAYWRSWFMELTDHCVC